MGKGNRAEPLTREIILKEALRLIDSVGLEGFSMRKLGSALGVEAMSIYNHIKNKENLLDGVVEVLYVQMEFPNPNDATPREQLWAIVNSYRKLLRAHPRVLPVVATRPVRTPAGLAFIERILAVIQQAGLNGEKTLYALNCTSSFVIGHALIDVGVVPIKGVTSEATSPLNIDPLQVAQLPNVRLLLPELVKRDPDREFEYGLKALFEGILGGDEKNGG